MELGQTVRNAVRTVALGTLVAIAACSATTSGPGNRVGEAGLPAAFSGYTFKKAGDARRINQSFEALQAQGYANDVGAYLEAVDRADGQDDDHVNAIYVAKVNSQIDLK
ncbi:MAG: hypothetical protein QF915_02915 [Candidatus Woesearchaeota archaeon]|nr:hypothetical protein [Candidatus Woesearchaeota archaeon]